MQTEEVEQQNAAAEEAAAIADEEEFERSVEFAELLASRSFGSFPRRVLAAMLDGSIINLLSLLFLSVFANEAVSTVLSVLYIDPLNTSRIFSLGASRLIWITVIPFVFSWMYYAWFESSSVAATPGKRLFGMCVVKTTSRRLTFLDASGRFLAKLVSALPLGIGFLLPLVSKRSQALHDIICDTAVLQRREISALRLYAAAVFVLIFGNASDDFGYALFNVVPEGGEVVRLHAGSASSLQSSQQEPAFVREVGPTVDFRLDSRRTQGAAAVYSSAARELVVAVYPRALAADERSAIAHSGAVLNVAKLAPIAAITFRLADGVKALTADKIQAYSITIFPGLQSVGETHTLENPVRFTYLSAGTRGQVTDLSGALTVGSTLTVTLKNDAERVDETGRLKVAWNLRLRAELLSVDGGASLPEELPQSEPATVASPTPLSVPTALPQGKSEAGMINVEQSSYTVRTVIGFYYPESGDVVVGFYAVPLSQEEEQTVRARKSVLVHVNNKRPAMVLHFDFPPGGSDPKFESLIGYTAYFYRSPAGGFGFPGVYDTVTLRRGKEELRAGDFRAIGGAVREGAPFSVDVSGRGRPPASSVEFSWDVRFAVPLTEAK